MEEVNLENVKKYRKKPVVIEAIKVGWETWGEICEFVDGQTKIEGVYLDENLEEKKDGKVSQTMGMKVETLEGTMLAREGDYLIKGVSGEFYPCKPDIFEKTYDEV